MELFILWITVSSCVWLVNWRTPFRKDHFVNISLSQHSIYSVRRTAEWMKRKYWTINLSLSPQLPSGIVGRPGTLKWLAWRFCAVLLDTIQTSFLLSGLLHSLERYSVMHSATSSFQWSSSLSLICEEDKEETFERLQAESLRICCPQQVKYFYTNTWSGCDAVMPPCAVSTQVFVIQRKEM